MPRGQRPPVAGNKVVVIVPRVNRLVVRPRYLLFGQKKKGTAVLWHHNALFFSLPQVANPQNARLCVLQLPISAVQWIFRATPSLAHFFKIMYHAREIIVACGKSFIIVEFRTVAHCKYTYNIRHFIG
jgi:hypothetical protein